MKHFLVKGNFVAHEAEDCGKSANAIVSELQYFFTNHGIGGWEEVVLHCNNYTDQNISSCIVQYLV